MGRSNFWVQIHRRSTQTSGFVKVFALGAFGLDQPPLLDKPSGYGVDPSGSRNAKAFGEFRQGRLISYWRPTFFIFN